MLVAIWAVATRGSAGSGTDRVPSRFILEDRAELSLERGSWNVQISADGRTIVYRGLSEGRNVLFRRSIDSTGARPIPGTEEVEFHAISSDSRWLAYTSAESGRPHVYARPLPGQGARVQISTEPSGSPVWNPGGDRLYFRTQRGMRAANLNVREDAIGVTPLDRLIDLDFYGSVASLHATSEVHPEGFSVAIDETDTNGQLVLWTHWLHEVQALLAEENGG
jgi:hypothetical protein